jgi:hypothetical protein
MRQAHISKSDLIGVALIRLDKRNVFGQVLVLVVPVFGLFLIFAAWEERLHGAPWGWILITGILVTLFAYGIAWVAGPGLQNFAISLSDTGVTIYDPTLRSQRLIARTYGWGELGPPRLKGRILSNVVFWGPDSPIELTANQARALLTDVRYPLRGQLTAPVAARIGTNRQTDRHA